MKPGLNLSILGISVGRIGSCDGGGVMLGEEGLLNFYRTH